MTKFQIICTNWADEDLQRHRSPSDDIYFYRPIVYNVYFKTNNGWSLLHSSSNAKTPAMHLPVNPNLAIKVEIADKIGAKETVQLTAHVQPFTAGANEILNSLFGPSGEMAKLFMENNHKGILRLENAVAAHINNKNFCPTQTQFTDNEQQLIRHKLIEYLMRILPLINTGFDIQQAAFTLVEIFYSEKPHYKTETKV